MKDRVSVDWLGGEAPGADCGVSWGVPWAQGSVARQTQFALADVQGQAIPVQSWALAYWPDGTLKWTGHSMSAHQGFRGPLTLAVGEPTAPATPAAA